MIAEVAWHVRTHLVYMLYIKYVPGTINNVAVVVVVLTLTRITKSVVTGQAPATLEWKNTPGKKQSKPKVLHVHILAEASHASAKKYKT